MQTTLIKVGEGYELRTTNRAIGDELALLAKATPFIIAGATYKRQRLSTGRTRQGYSGFFAFEPHEFVHGAADTVVCLDGLLECSAPTGGFLGKAFAEHTGEIADLLRVVVDSPTLYLQRVGRIHRQTFGAENPQHQQIPKAAQWDGEGLPPVGVDCEVLWSSTTGDYVTCKVLAHDEGEALIRYTAGQRKGQVSAQNVQNYGRPGAPLPNFRPIKTAERLAAEQREAEIERLEAVFIRFCKARYAASPTGEYTHRMVAEAFHSEGARLPEEKC